MTVKELNKTKSRGATSQGNLPKGVKNASDALSILEVSSASELYKTELVVKINNSLLELASTQKERASILGVPPSSLSLLERYDLTGFSLDRIYDYAAQLGLVKSRDVGENVRPSQSP